jgi:zinc transporter 9
MYINRSYTRWQKMWTISVQYRLLSSSSSLLSKDSMRTPCYFSGLIHHSKTRVENLTLPWFTESYRHVSSEQHPKLGRRPLEEELQNFSHRTVLRALGGNALITVAKYTAYFYSGSSAMLAETIHTLVDTANQALLLMGLRQARRSPDRRFQYGYGRDAFFYSLVSAVGMFWLGCVVTVYHGIDTMMHPFHAHVYNWWTWSVLSLSFMIDGAVLLSVIREVKQFQPHRTLFQQLRSLKDPMILSVILEDFAATTGVLMAFVGIGVTNYTGNVYWDGLASVSIGTLLGGVALTLMRINRGFLLGKAVDPDIEVGIYDLLKGRPSIEAIYAVQSRWEGPTTFAYKAEIDVRGTYFANKLKSLYLERMLKSNHETFEELLNMYTEDVTRLIESEIYDIQKTIQTKYPEAKFIGKKALLKSVGCV